jgi:hypothetical protein
MAVTAQIATTIATVDRTTGTAAGHASPTAGAATRAIVAMTMIVGAASIEIAVTGDDDRRGGYQGNRRNDDDRRGGYQPRSPR